jgi:transcriptional repressor NrdR
MRCPKCATLDTQVYDTRAINSGKNIRRRRECNNCKFRFVTLEEVKAVDIFVKKRSGQEVPFDIEKIKVGLSKSFNKRKVGPDLITAVAADVLSKIIALNQEIVPSQKIGETVLETLKEHDEAAFICYFAMFGNFASSKDFIDLINSF